jgi:adenine-specific DNA-methyltransferase
MAAGASQDLFITPKPSSLIERVLQIATNPGDLILDSFAGSGTTGHAVLKLNAANPSAKPRRFILIEMEIKVVREITAERVRRVAQGYINAKDHQIEGLGEGFRYCELGAPLFDAQGGISGLVKFADLAAHLYFTETGQPLPDIGSAGSSPLLGLHEGVAVYLLFNGILGDKTVNGGNVLTAPVLASLPQHDGPKIIYGEGNRLGIERMRREGITFKQIPYQIRLS